MLDSACKSKRKTSWDDMYSLLATICPLLMGLINNFVIQVLLRFILGIAIGAVIKFAQCMSPRWHRQQKEELWV